MVRVVLNLDPGMDPVSIVAFFPGVVGSRLEKSVLPPGAVAAPPISATARNGSRNHAICAAESHTMRRRRASLRGSLDERIAKKPRVGFQVGATEDSDERR